MSVSLIVRSHNVMLRSFEEELKTPPLLPPYANHPMSEFQPLSQGRIWSRDLVLSRLPACLDEDGFLHASFATLMKLTRLGSEIPNLGSPTTLRSHISEKPAMHPL